jgi:16S rRNA (guanine527-N7)-methyltransferase
MSILGSPLSETQARQSGTFLGMLQEWNTAQRLVGRGDPDWLVRALFLDSLLFLRALRITPTTLLDLGSGAGFPGVPLKIVLPGTSVVLLEARRRRASFLRAVVRELRIDGLTVIESRAERAVSELAGRFEAVVTRCSGNPRDVFPLAMKFARPGGCVVSTASETQAGWATVHRISVPGLDAGSTRAFMVSDAAR